MKNKKSPMHKVTLEEVLRVTKISFSNIEEKIAIRFDAVDARFNKMDERFNEIDDRFNKVDSRFDKVENLLIRAHDNRLDRLEDDVRKIKTIIGDK